MLRGKRLIEKDDFTEDDLYNRKIKLADDLTSILPPNVIANKQLTYILKKMLDPDPAKRYSSAREAEVGDDGLKIISKQLVQANLDSEYATDLSDYLTKLIDPKTQRIELAFKEE
jgi:serine/threonine-protein kinase